LTSIEWTASDDGVLGKTWNPVRGCQLESPGCLNCYAMRFAHRFSGKGKPYEGLTKLGPKGPIWTGEVRLALDKLAEPLRWRKPCRVFVNSMSDLFHPKVSFEYIAAVFGVMHACPDHTFQILTKHPDRAVEFFKWVEDQDICKWTCAYLDKAGFERGCGSAFDVDEWPLKNVWIGASVEDQKRADLRIPLLLQIPAVVHFLSCEPLLEHVEIDSEFLTGEYAPSDEGGAAAETPGPRIDWIIVGGESSHGARPMHPDWARSLRDQCVAAGVAFFFKQWGNWSEIEYDHENPPGDKPRERYINAAGGHGFHGEQVVRLRSRGKKANGRLLDGRTWDEFPRKVA
jgi:protein gp37